MQLWASTHHDVPFRPRIMTMRPSAIFVADHDVTFFYDCFAFDTARPSGSSLESRDLRLRGEEPTPTPSPAAVFLVAEKTRSQEKQVMPFRTG